MRVSTAAALLLLFVLGCRTESSQNATSSSRVEREASAPDAGSEALDPSTMTVVLLGKSGIIVDDRIIVPLPSREKSARHGVDARYKRDESSPYIIPLGDAVKRSRMSATERKQDPQPGTTAMILADEATPYRLVTEVVDTLDSNDGGFNEFLLKVLEKDSADIVTVRAGWRQRSAIQGNPKQIVVFVGERGIVLRTGSDGFSARPSDAGTDPKAFITKESHSVGVGKGCIPGGEGLTFPREGAVHDLTALQACVRVLKERPGAEHVFLSPAEGTDFREIVAVVRALEGDGLFSRVYLGPAFPNPRADAGAPRQHR